MTWLHGKDPDRHRLLESTQGPMHARSLRTSPESGNSIWNAELKVDFL
ncbi:rCG62124, partial [Rattus norvegicus]